MDPSSNARDDDLIASAKTGDEEAWRRLYAQLGGRLYGWLNAQSVHDASLDADDLSNEAWMTAARRIAEFSGSVDDFAGWLFVIARNLAVNANRRSLRRGTVPTELDPRQLVPPPPFDADEEVAAVDAADWIRRLMSHLSDRERDVVALVDVAGVDLTTAAHVLGLNRTAVRVAHHRAMRRLAELLATVDDPTDLRERR